MGIEPFEARPSPQSRAPDFFWQRRPEGQGGARGPRSGRPGRPTGYKRAPHGHHGAQDAACRPWVITVDSSSYEIILQATEER